MATISLATLNHILLAVSVSLSSVITLILFTAPSQYDPFGHLKKRGPGAGQTNEDEKFKELRDRTAKPPEPEKSIQIVVLGDIGRSPRMQYHAISFAKHGGRVDLIGFKESEVHPDVSSNPLINIVSLVPVPPYFQTGNKFLFPLLAPLKVLWQVWTLYHALGYRTEPSRWMMVQNPPSIPTLAIAAWICFFRNTSLIVDWHNFGYSILGLKLGSSHPLVLLSKWYERFFARRADSHFAVTDAMVGVLKDQFGVKALALHDRPARQFLPLLPLERKDFLERLPETAQYAKDILSGKWRLLVSSSSWTPDEDFHILLSALQTYSSRATKSSFPKILAIITGKGPQKEYYLSKISALNQANMLENVIVTTAWLSTEDYASLLGAADLGVSLHTSSSGVDLPMKVVDMFGAGLPVVGWSKFEAWPELVKEGVNGRGFESSAELADLLVKLFGGSSERLTMLKAGATEEGRRRWDDEWEPVAGKLFRFVK